MDMIAGVMTNTLLKIPLYHICTVQHQWETHLDYVPALLPNAYAA